MNPEQMKILAISNGSFGTYGFGDTIDEALKNAKKPKTYTIYVAHPETTVRSDGGISFPHGFPPKAIQVKKSKS